MGTDKRVEPEPSTHWQSAGEGGEWHSFYPLFLTDSSPSISPHPGQDTYWNRILTMTILHTFAADKLETALKYLVHKA